MVERDSGFKAGVAYALLSGICLGLVGRFSQGMSKKSLLPHESFMAFYDALFTCCCALISIIPEKEARQDNYKAMSTNLIWPLIGLACLTALKSLIWERGTM